MPTERRQRALAELTVDVTGVESAPREIDHAQPEVVPASEAKRRTLGLMNRVGFVVRDELVGELMDDLAARPSTVGSNGRYRQGVAVPTDDHPVGVDVVTSALDAGGGRHVCLLAVFPTADREAVDRVLGTPPHHRIPVGAAIADVEAIAEHEVVGGEGR